MKNEMLIKDDEINYKEELKNWKWIWLLPILSSLFFFYKGYKFLGLYVDDFLQTVRTMTQEERNNYIEKFEKEKAERKSEKNILMLSFIAMSIYYLIFGDSHILNVFTTTSLRIVYFTFVEIGNSFSHAFTHYQNFKGM
ncbi:hypothetical protein [Aquitalea pelogenes]|uniref:hypothetical protein n=1 Tax=Aquitalea pelogenes TaxID=1293573 RepID=UPI0035AEA0B9